MDLEYFVRVGRYDLPTTDSDTAPAGNELASEASAVTYNWDTDTLFVIGDEGTSIVQVSKTGALIDTMTIPAGTFDDTEGLAYVGGGQFAVIEERDRTVNLVTYAGDTTLDPSTVKTVDLGTDIGNIGLEGVAFDPVSGDYVFVKENDPQSVFSSGVDFDAGTATNGSATTENSTNLFDPALLGLNDLSDVYALSALPAAPGEDPNGNLLILSQESGLILEVDPTDGSIVSQLTIQGDDDNPLSVVDQGHEGLAFDRDGNLYVVSEQGGGADTPQLWVYRMADFENAAPTAIDLENTITELAENASTEQRVRLGDVAITDDGIGPNALSISGDDAALFSVDATGLYLNAGVTLDFETQASYMITVSVDDPTVGNTPDASTDYTLTITDVVNEDGVQTAVITEAAPWSSGDSPVGADWFELTNTGSEVLDITGWRFDDDSADFGESDALEGITSLAPGESVIFLDSDAAGFAALRSAFIDTWFDGVAPEGLQIGYYDGAGLGTGGDGIVLFDAAGTVQSSLFFGASPEASPFATFDNSAEVQGSENSTPSGAGLGGAYEVVNGNGDTEIGSPGTAGKVFVSEAAPWSSGDSPVGEDWFELTNSSTVAVDITGWRFDDDSVDYAASEALEGITELAAGESVIFLNTGAGGFDEVRAAFIDTWFGGVAPEDLQFGYYDGAGLGTGGDGVFLFDALGNLETGMTFGEATEPPALATFDNAAGLEFAEVTTLSSPGFNGAFSVTPTGGFTETGSPGTIVTDAPVDNDAPTALTLENVTTQIAEGTQTPTRIKVADVSVTDDGVGFNALSLSGADAEFFEVDASGLYLNALVALDFDAKAQYEVTVEVDDPTVGATPDASTTYTLEVTDVAGDTDPAIRITEVAPWSSGDSPVGEDWFELTNFSEETVSIDGWRYDDDSVDFEASDPLEGITEIAAGESVIFLNTDAAGFAEVQTAFVDSWFGGVAPAGLQFGYYDGAGLGGGGDAVILFDAAGDVQANLFVGASPEEAPLATFDNSVGLNNTLTDTLSETGLNGGFTALGGADEIGSPGTVATVIDGSFRRDTLLGTNGNDIMLGGLGADTLIGEAGNDVLNGSLGRDTLMGGAGDDDLNGGLGRDVLIGGLGDDHLAGGLGADRFVFDNATDTGADVVEDMTGIDLLLFTQQLDAADLALTNSTLELAGGGSVDVAGVDMLDYLGLQSFGGLSYHAYGL